MDKTRADIAEELFRNGANCSQAVVGAFEDLLHADRKMLMMLSSSFGGGLARLREVCGAVSGGAIVLGILYGIDDVHTHDEKKKHYKLVSSFANDFSSSIGSYICSEIISEQKSTYVPSERTKEYYDHRPCIRCVRKAAMLLEEIISEFETENK